MGGGVLAAPRLFRGREQGAVGMRGCARTCFHVSAAVRTTPGIHTVFPRTEIILIHSLSRTPLPSWEDLGFPWWRVWPVTKRSSYPCPLADLALPFGLSHSRRRDAPLPRFVSPGSSGNPCPCSPGSHALHASQTILFVPCADGGERDEACLGSTVRLRGGQPGPEQGGRPVGNPAAFSFLPSCCSRPVAEVAGGQEEKRFGLTSVPGSPRGFFLEEQEPYTPLVKV